MQRKENESRGVTGRERSWGGEELSEGGLSARADQKRLCRCVWWGRSTGIMGRADYGVALHLLKSNIRLVGGIWPRDPLIYVGAGAYPPMQGVLHCQGCCTLLPGNSHHLNPPKS